MKIDIEATLSFTVEMMGQIKRCAEKHNVSVPQYLIDAICRYTENDSKNNAD